MTEQQYVEKLQTLVNMCESAQDNWDDLSKRQLLVQQIFTELEDFHNLQSIEESKHIYSLIRLNTDQFNLQQVSHMITSLNRAINQEDINSEYAVTTQDLAHKLEPFPIVVVLENLRSGHNVGSIIRSAESFNLEKLYFTGYTPNPENDKVIKTSMSAEKNIEWQSNYNTIEVIEQLKSLGYTLIALETTTEAIALNEIEFTEKTAVFFGNERFGLSKDVLPYMDQIVRIPLYGMKNSLNVSVCAGIVFNQLVEKCQNQ